jgi:hypothetical protein
VSARGSANRQSTPLVELLAKMYEPSSGSILVDDTAPSRVPTGEWRARLAGDVVDRLTSGLNTQLGPTSPCEALARGSAGPRRTDRRVGRGD